MASNVYNTLSVIRGSHRYNSWLYNQIERHLSGSVLDIGSGLGDIAGQFTNPAIDEVILSDYSNDMIQALQSTPLPIKKHRIIQLDISSPKTVEQHPAGIADTITCVNVLEHIDDHILALRNMKHLLKEKGKVVIFVPALQAIYGTLDVHVEHYRRYTKKDLRKAFEEAGFKVQEAYYMNMFGILTWFFAGRVLKQKRFHKRACGMLDHMVPFLRTVERFGPPPLGQSLVMVGQK